MATLLLSFSESMGLPWTLLLWALCLVALIVRSATRVAGVLFATITAYGTTAWLAAAFGNHYYPPFPALRYIEATTLTDVRSVVLAFAVMEVLIGSVRLGQAVMNAGLAAKTLLLRLADSQLRYLILGAPIIVGMLDWITVARIGLGAVLGGSRREFAGQLLLGSQHNVQFIVVAVSIAAAVLIAFSQRKLSNAFALALCWSPFVLVGSRKELLLVASAVGVVLIAVGLRKPLLVIGVILTFMFVRPVLSSGDIYDSLHEFILPQYMHFAVTSGYISPTFGGNFFARAQFLIPGPLRWGEPVDLALAFYKTGTANVGVGASPFAEAAVATQMIPVELTFALLFNAILLLVVVCSRSLPFITIVGFAQLLTFGRSDTWIAMFFVIYVGLALHTLTFLTRKSTHETSIPLRHEYPRTNRGTRQIPRQPSATREH